MKKIILLLLFYFFTIAFIFPKSDTTQISVSNNQDAIFASSDSSFISFSNHNKGNNWLELSIPLIVAIIGGLIAIYQVRINIIKSARINWIENLRDNISRFIVSTLDVRNILDKMTITVDSGEDPDVAFKKYTTEYMKAINESMMYAIKIKLYLNTLENVHKELVSKIDEFIDHIQNTFTNKNREKTKEDIFTIMTLIIKLSQSIIKTEWDKVSKSWVKKYLYNVK